MAKRTPQEQFLTAVVGGATDAAAVARATGLPAATAEAFGRRFEREGVLTPGVWSLTRKGLVVAYEPIARKEAARGFTRCRGRLPDGTEGKDEGGALWELQQEAILALCRAAQNFDPSKLTIGAKGFPGYAKTYCYRAVQALLGEDFHTPLPERDDERVEDATEEPEVDPVDQQRVRDLLRAGPYSVPALWKRAAELWRLGGTDQEVVLDARGWHLEKRQAEDPIILGLLEQVRRDWREMIGAVAPDRHETPQVPIRRAEQLPLPLPEIRPVLLVRERAPRRVKTPCPWTQLSLIPGGHLRLVRNVAVAA